MFKPIHEIKAGDLITHRYMNAHENIYDLGLCSNSVYTVINVIVNHNTVVNKTTYHTQLLEMADFLLFWSGEAVEVVSL